MNVSMHPKGLCDVEENICFDGAAEPAVRFKGLFFTNTLARSHFIILEKVMRIE